MKLLLDTHALLWALNDPDKLGDEARGLIVDPANEVFASVVSLWEILVKKRAGKLRIDLARVLHGLNVADFELLAIKRHHLAALETLPMHHRDPFDDLLLAQALADKLTFLSDDRDVRHYAVPFLPCSR